MAPGLPREGRSAGGKRTTAFQDEEGGNGNGVEWRFSQTVCCRPGTVPGAFITDTY